MLTLSEEEQKICTGLGLEMKILNCFYLNLKLKEKVVNWERNLKKKKRVQIEVLTPYSEWREANTIRLPPASSLNYHLPARASEGSQETITPWRKENCMWFLDPLLYSPKTMGPVTMGLIL